MIKVIVSALFISIFLIPATYTLAESETKQVCVDKIAANGKPVLGKDGKPQQDCKTIKVHKKLEGTKVPDKK